MKWFEFRKDVLSLLLTMVVINEPSPQMGEVWEVLSLGGGQILKIGRWVDFFFAHLLGGLGLGGANFLGGCS